MKTLTLMVAVAILCAGSARAQVSQSLRAADPAQQLKTSGMMDSAGQVSVGQQGAAMATSPDAARDPLVTTTESAAADTSVSSSSDEDTWRTHQNASVSARSDARVRVGRTSVDSRFEADGSIASDSHMPRIRTLIGRIRDRQQSRID